MGRPSIAKPPPPAERVRARAIVARLAKAHPDWGPTLDFTTPLELLIATILAAQARDERVNEVTKPLFAKYRNAADWVRVPERVLEKELKPTGFFRMKTKAVKAASQGLVERFGGEVPRTMDQLVSLRGVGRKTASIVLGAAFGVPSVAVDRHVARVAQRLGLTRSGDPEKIEADLQVRLPRTQWVKATWCLVLHGRRICRPVPECPSCPVLTLCPYGLARTRPGAAAPARGRAAAGPRSAHGPGRARFGAAAPARGRATAERRSGYERKTVALSPVVPGSAPRRAPRAPRRPGVRRPSQG